MTEDRIEVLETRLTHQDQAVRELGDEVYRQQRELEGLRRLVETLKQRLSSLDDGGAADGAADEPPPHY